MRRCSGWHIVALAALSVATMAARSADAGVQEPAASDVDAPMTGTVVIGSKNFTENRLLAEIMAALIEASTRALAGPSISEGRTASTIRCARTSPSIASSRTAGTSNGSSRSVSPTATRSRWIRK
jgi:glycine betaine/choline ABC-type transport system substrate-binding protein